MFFIRKLYVKPDYKYTENTTMYKTSKMGSKIENACNNSLFKYKKVISKT
jgi:hypothetical protein